MRYQNDGEGGKEEELLDRHGSPEEFSVTRGDNGDVVLELWGGSSHGEYYTLTLQEAENLMNQLISTVRVQRHAIGRGVKKK